MCFLKSKESVEEEAPGWRKLETHRAERPRAMVPGCPQDGHAPVREGSQARREQVRGPGRHFFKKMKRTETMMCLDMLGRDLDNCQNLEWNL